MSFEDLLKSLQLDYINALPSKIAQINQQIHSGDLSSVRESFHKFKGTGRTYGLPEVSILSELVERICTHLPNVALSAASNGTRLLEDIYLARRDQREFPLLQDPRFLEIRKHLQS